jgi:hypothetical protein
MKLETFFIMKMVDLGWTEINDPQSPATAANSVAKSELDGRLQSCLSRYNASVSLQSPLSAYKTCSSKQKKKKCPGSLGSNHCNNRSFSSLVSTIDPLQVLIPTFDMLSSSFFLSLC